MMVELSFERLYLAKSCKNGEDIYVDKCPLVQHQLDGIRYLYRAFKKKKPAVILNDPSGYGKRVQTALFLSAVLNTLDKPVLILCREGTEQRWMRHFQQWTQVSDDVAIELKNPFIKKRVVISLLYCATEFSRRQWSMLVVDDDLITRDLLKSSLKADFKVWITSSAVKEDLSKFTTFYSWVYPKDKFVADKYKAKKGDLKHILLKTAMLDAFLEDTVLRRDCDITPFTKTQVSTSNPELRITKKNKDATGTKIKRSKRKSTDADNMSTGTYSKLPKTMKPTNKIEQNTEVFEIGDFNGEKPNVTTNISLKETVTDININTQSDDDDFVSSCKNKKSKLRWDSEDSNDDVKTTDIEIDKFKDQDTKLHESSESKVLHWDSDTDNEPKETEIDSNKAKLSTTATTDQPQMKIDEIVDKNLENNGCLLVNELLNNNDTENEIIDKTNPESEDLLLTNPNEINVKNVENSGCLLVNELLNNNDTENEIIEKTNLESEDLFLTNPNEINVKEIVYETEDKDQPVPSNSKENGGTQAKTNKPENANLSSFELKMKELEELTLKKYKGSFLDKIF